jgi:uncharacterized phage-associated protein
MAVQQHYDALTVARELVLIGAPATASEDADAVYLSPLHLQKLLYYCQGWGLALLGRPLFCQPLYAWQYGPVVRDVYDLFKGRSSGVLPQEFPSVGGPMATTPAALVVMVWREYSRYTPGELVAMTHREPPWREARANLPEGAHSDAILSHTTMREFFTTQAAAFMKNKPGFPAFTAAELWSAEEAFEQSGRRTTPASDLLAKLLKAC